MFTKGSRYAAVDEAMLVNGRGREIRYKKIRIIPSTPGALGHVVSSGERLDHIAQRYYQDPSRYWRICDANRVLAPEELEAEAGAVIIIPRAEG